MTYSLPGSLKGMSIDEQRAALFGLATGFHCCRDPYLDPTLQVETAKNGDHYWRWTLASNPSLCVEAQVILAASEEDIQVKLAERLCQLEPAAQLILASSDSVDVRDNLAGNGEIHKDAQAILVNDPSPRVRATLAANYQCHRDTRIALSYDTDVNVLRCVSSVHTLPSDVRLSARFTYKYSPLTYRILVSESDREAAGALAANWEGSIESLLEACQLVGR